MLRNGDQKTVKRKNEDEKSSQTVNIVKKQKSAANHSFFTPTTSALNTTGELQKTENVDAKSNLETVETSYNPRLIGEALVESTKQMVDLMMMLNANAFSYIPKATLQASFDIIKAGEAYYAVEHGAIHSKTVGENKSSLLNTYLIQNIDTGQYFILKAYTINDDDQLLAKIQDEIKLLIKAKQFVAQVDDRSFNKTFYIIKTYAPGLSLKDAMDQGVAKLNFNEKVEVAKKVIETLMTLHRDSKIIHCDLKLENIVLNLETMEVQIIDFDVSLHMDENEQASTKEIRGTFKHLAPEIIAQSKDGTYVYNKKTDTFALGVALAEWLELEDYLSDDFKQNELLLTQTASNLFTSKLLPPQQETALKAVRGLMDPNDSTRLDLASAFELLSDKQLKTVATFS